MKRERNTRETELRYIGLDVHKHYITVGGMNAEQEIVLRPRDVEMERFKRWAESNLRKSDEVVLEATTNTWDVYDTIAPLVKRIVVAHPAEVKQIANSRVKTDNQDVIRLVRLLIADIVPEVWVPPLEVRELRAMISYRWRLVKMSTARWSGSTSTPRMNRAVERNERLCSLLPVRSFTSDAPPCGAPDCNVTPSMCSKTALNIRQVNGVLPESRGFKLSSRISSSALGSACATGRSLLC